MPEMLLEQARTRSFPGDLRGPRAAKIWSRGRFPCSCQGAGTRWACLSSLLTQTSLGFSDLPHRTPQAPQEAEPTLDDTS